MSQDKRSRPDNARVKHSQKDRVQPYATESDDYTADNVKPPTAPEQRHAAKGAKPGEPTPKHHRR
jgi:hypothetical protein